MHTEGRISTFLNSSLPLSFFVSFRSPIFFFLVYFFHYSLKWRHKSATFQLIWTRTTREMRLLWRVSKTVTAALPRDRDRVQVKEKKVLLHGLRQAGHFTMTWRLLQWTWERNGIGIRQKPIAKALVIYHSLPDLKTQVRRHQKN